MVKGLGSVPDGDAFTVEAAESTDEVDDASASDDVGDAAAT